MNIKRMRGRGRYNNHGLSSGRNNGVGGVPLNKNYVFDSNGPDVRIRGTAQQLYEKYLQMGRDATAGDDRIMAESYFQYAEHYFRLWEIMNQGQENRQFHRYGEGEEEMTFSSDKKKMKLETIVKNAELNSSSASGEVKEEISVVSIEAAKISEEENFSGTGVDQKKGENQESKKIFRNVKLIKKNSEERTNTGKHSKTECIRGKSEKSLVENTEALTNTEKNESLEKISQFLEQKMSKKSEEPSSETRLEPQGKNDASENVTDTGEIQLNETLSTTGRLRSVRRSMRRPLRSGALTQQPLLTHSDD